MNAADGGRKAGRPAEAAPRKGKAPTRDTRSLFERVGAVLALYQKGRGFY